jgi:hypothetical protein
MPSTTVDELLARGHDVEACPVHSRRKHSPHVNTRLCFCIREQRTRLIVKCDTCGGRSRRPQRRRHEIVEEEDTAASARVSGMPPIKERKRIHDDAKARELEQTVQQNKALPP